MRDNCIHLSGDKDHINTIPRTKKNFKKSKGTFSLEKLNPKFESKVVQWSIGKEVSPGKQNQQLVEESIEEDVEFTNANIISKLALKLLQCRVVDQMV